MFVMGVVIGGNAGIHRLCSGSGLDDDIRCMAYIFIDRIRQVE